MVKARKSVWSMVKTPKGAGQSFDLAVTAVTIESMGVTPPPVAGYGTDCQYNFSALLSLSRLLLFAFSFCTSQQKTHSPFLLPCVIEYESVPTDLSVFLHYSTDMTPGNLMFHTLYCMHQIYSIESPINAAQLQLLWGLLTHAQQY